MKKILIAFFIFVFTLNTTNAWLWLIAETNDLLNNSKWNGFFNEKVSRTDVKAGNNIKVTESWDDIFINKGIAVSVPFVSTTTQVEIPGESTTTITLDWENFESGSLVTISWITVNYVNVISPIKMEINLTTHNLWEFDVVVNNNWKLNTLWANNWEDLIKVVPVGITWNDSTWRKWTNWKIAATCNDYKNPADPYEYSWDTWDGIYWIKPDANQTEFKVYCDMTSDWWGWTRFVNIKWDYSKTDAINCWLGTNINNSNLDCFNPNRYWVNPTTLMNIDWSGNYTYTMLDSNNSVTTRTENWKRKCIGHDEYMTIMKWDEYPEEDWSNTDYVRLARSFCKYSRDPAGRWWSFMNYDPSGDFWESDSAARESNARDTKVYFR
jgi:hypothetical protein